MACLDLCTRDKETGKTKTKVAFLDVWQPIPLTNTDQEGMLLLRTAPNLVLQLCNILEGWVKAENLVNDLLAPCGTCEL